MQVDNDIGKQLFHGTLLLLKISQLLTLFGCLNSARPLQVCNHIQSLTSATALAEAPEGCRMLHSCHLHPTHAVGFSSG